MILAATPVEQSPDVVGPADPADQIVGAAALLDLVAEFLERFVVFASKSQVHAVALWVLHSHAIDQADTSPYLAVTSAEKRSGKTLLLDVLELLAARPWRAVLPSEAVVYRKVAADQPTLLLDEVDAIFGPKTAGNHEGLRALLNAGNREGTTVPRIVGEGAKMKVQDFPVFCAKVLAGIGKLPDTVRDRAIPIRLQRRLRSETVERFRRREVHERASLICMALTDVASHLEVADARPEIPSQLNDRAADGWEPLLAIADRLGGHWPERARRAAVALSVEADADEASLGIKLLDDIRGILRNRTEWEAVFSDSLLTALWGLDESPWKDFELSPRRLAKLLKPYGLTPMTVRAGIETRKGYHRDALLAACDRWLDPSTLAATEQPENVTTSQTDGSEYAETSSDGADCDAVTDRAGFVTPGIADPRPDLVDDSHQWQRLLTAASEDADKPHGLFGALLGLRSCGVTLIPIPTGGLRLSPGEMTDDDYRQDREKWLAPHADTLTRLLQEPA